MAGVMQNFMKKNWRDIDEMVEPSYQVKLDKQQAAAELEKAIAKQKKEAPAYIGRGVQEEAKAVHDATLNIKESRLEDEREGVMRNIKERNRYYSKKNFDPAAKAMR